MFFAAIYDTVVLILQNIKTKMCIFWLYARAMQCTWIAVHGWMAIGLIGCATALELPDVKFICIYYITVCYSVSVYLTEHLKML